MSDVVHFCGLIPGSAGDEAGLQARLSETLRMVGHGYGGLAAGADIVVAETLLDLGAEVTAVLPFPPQDYLVSSVLPGGADWAPRYERCLQRVRLRVLGPRQCDDLDYAMASSRAMGLACLQARQVGAKCLQVAIWDGGGAGLAGTAADVQRWREAGHETLVLASPWQRRVRGVASAPQRLRVAKVVLWTTSLGVGDPPQVFDDPAEAARSALVLAADPGIGVMLDFAALAVDRLPVRPEWTSPTGVVGVTEAFACELSLRDGGIGLSRIGGAGEAAYVVAPPAARG